jgi:hypothetical protein
LESIVRAKVTDVQLDLDVCATTGMNARSRACLIAAYVSLSAGPRNRERAKDKGAPAHVSRPDDVGDDPLDLIASPHWLWRPGFRRFSRPRGGSRRGVV